MNTIEELPESKFDHYSKRSITFRNVNRLYPYCTPTGVEEFWIYGQGWIKNGIKGEVTEQIREALKHGATKIQLHLRNERFNQDIYPDYHVRELTD
ncbi:hypothetical protein DSL64_21480 [Dyadobacter luteus]|uniref:Uncharacterized protein n=1 Tax=Dyadobacter luteus TaxID=2259619 RepID=A0A3D8Y9E9_9BACT|nr:hypothetical protein [Dyadobacter luteus]REA58182.1 hypothetical protein DSL64_21480 [Dyadobacter luteus]